MAGEAEVEAGAEGALILAGAAGVDGPRGAGVSLKLMAAGGPA